MTTSFPYLAVAKKYGVLYAEVLRFAEVLDDLNEPAPQDGPAGSAWRVATYHAWQAERVRRCGR